MTPKTLFLVLGTLLLFFMWKPLHAESKSFDLQHLEGCHKGESKEGLQELKRYLEKIGYLNYDDTAKKNNHANDDKFDELLESAIRRYQSNYHLKTTGNLDSATIKKMSLPRCGVADIVNAGASSVPTDRKLKHDHGLHTVSHYSFFSRRQRWSPMKTNLTYRFSSSVQVVGLEDLRSACSSAFKRWQDVSHFTFQEASEGAAAADIVIGFHRGNHGDGVQNAFNGPTLAHAFAPEDGRFHYDADEKWSLNPSSDQVDLESVAVHEIGHLLGLRHTPDIPGAIMYPEFSYGIIKRNLHPDDIEGIRVLYS
ncbi:hypothetical protein RJ640_029879 [Escallonia rubra]|uniref:Peptidase metallopeptidase domain-containing protein n=1 Tax=Escallonia rubra TaxID=112253 RepID=A0AA88R407_9ASTE|nr:hypothetical protein RJ640_029879 [Escallonia rubra]